MTNVLFEEWLERTLKTYPEHSSRFFFGEKDRFRNPIGHTLREGLAILLEELLGAMDSGRLQPALEEIVRMRAVQNFTPSEAVGFLFLLKEVARERMTGAELVELESRVDRATLLAFDLFMRCREKIYEIQAEEAKRRVFVLERAQGRRGASS